MIKVRVIKVQPGGFCFPWAIRNGILLKMQLLCIVVIVTSFAVSIECRGWLSWFTMVCAVAANWVFWEIGGEVERTHHRVSKMRHVMDSMYHENLEELIDQHVWLN